MIHQISLNNAKTMIQAYSDKRETILAKDYQGQDILALSETFDINAIQTLILNGAMKLRIYYGMDTLNKVHAILVGVDANGKDILPTTNLGAVTELILEESTRCPEVCPPPSALNGQ